MERKTVDKTLTADRDTVIRLYNAHYDKCTREVLRDIFGEDVFKPKDVTERIKTFDDTYWELGEEHPFVKEYNALQNADNVIFGGLSMDIVAYIKLRIICAALNEGWEPKFTEDEWRYYPWFWLYTQDEINDMDEQDKQDRHLISTGDYLTEYAGFAYAPSGEVPSNSSSTIGSRLCFKSERLATYCGKQFIELWADFKLIRK